MGASVGLAAHQPSNRLAAGFCFYSMAFMFKPYNRFRYQSFFYSFDDTVGQTIASLLV